MMILLDGLEKGLNTNRKESMRKKLQPTEIPKHKKSWCLGMGEKGKQKAETYLSCSLHKESHDKSIIIHPNLWKTSGKPQLRGIL